MNKIKPADVKSLRNYFLSDRKHLITRIEERQKRKRVIRRMERRVNKAILANELFA